MATNYDRTQLLRTALEHSRLTIDDLANRLNLSPILVYHNLESEETADETISAIATELGIPEAYFRGKFYYDDRGQLVPSVPE